MSFLTDIFKSCCYCFYSFKCDDTNNDETSRDIEKQKPNDAETDQSIVLDHLSENNDTSSLDFKDTKTEKLNGFDFDFDSDSDI